MARIVYVGQLHVGATALSRARALVQLGHEVVTIEGFPPEPALRRLTGGLRRHFAAGPPHPVNTEIMGRIAERRTDILWVDKGQNVAPATIDKAHALTPGLRIIYYTPDDIRIRGNVTRDLLRSLPLYDLTVTTKTHNLEHLRSMGAHRVLMSWQGFDPECHHRVAAGELDSSLRERVVFVGAYEPSRARTIEALLRAGLSVTVISAWVGWSNLAGRFPNLEWRHFQDFGRYYAVALASGAVSLGFLRKQAGDQHTTRSFEIPACGGVMLAERTEEHLQLFQEGREAEFFGSDEECVAKCRVLLSDPVLRARIAEGGHRRCIEGGYSWAERMKQILAEAEKLRT